MADQKMLKFVDVSRDMPSKRDAGARNRDYQEIYAEYAKAKAEENPAEKWNAAQWAEALKANGTETRLSDAVRHVDQFDLRRVLFR